MQLATTIPRRQLEVSNANVSSPIRGATSRTHSSFRIQELIPSKSLLPLPTCPSHRRDRPSLHIALLSAVAVWRNVYLDVHQEAQLAVRCLSTENVTSRYIMIILMLRWKSLKTQQRIDAMMLRIGERIGSLCDNDSRIFLNDYIVETFRKYLKHLNKKLSGNNIL